MLACMKNYANVKAFLVIFCLCYFLETITFTYLISAIQSIEKQFQIPSSKSGFLVSANDIGYVLTVVFLAYLGSKGNRARFIGGGCLLISFACLLISMPHFIFPHRELTTNDSMVREVLKPPAYLTYPNVTEEQILNFPPIRNRLPKSAYDFLLSKVRGESPSTEKNEFDNFLDYLAGDDDYDYFGRYDENENLSKSFDDDENLRRRRQLEPSQELIDAFFEVRYQGKNVSYLFDLVKKQLNAPPPEKIVKGIQRAAGMPSGHCSPIVNRIKMRIRSLKCWEKRGNDAAFAMVFVGIMLIGVGHSMPWSLGVPMIDDNVKKRSTPFYFAGVFFIRIMGPVLGFLIGSACSRLYFTLKKPGILPMDPRWIGAWWLGFLIIFLALVFPSILLFCFPTKGQPKVPNKNESQANGIQMETKAEQKTEGQVSVNLVDVHKTKQQEKASVFAELQGFIKAMSEVLKSRVYTAALMGRLFDAFAFKGFFVFLPKYLENHFGLPQYKANFFLGILGVFGFASGIVIGSLIMKRFKLEGRRAALYVGCCSLISSLLFFSKIGLGCHSVVNTVGRVGQQNNFNFTQGCNADCVCDPISLFPVCDEAGTPFYSACTAGCKNMTMIGDRSKKQFSFSDCVCVNSTLSPSKSVSRENCKDDCTVPLIAYFALSIFSGIIGGASVIPSVLISLRSVPPQFRSVALGFGGFLASLLSTFPSPIVYGALIDGACLLWNYECGARGSCQIYNPSVLRVKMHGFNGALRIGGLIFDCFVIYWAKGLKLMEEEPPADDNPNKVQQKRSQIEEDVKALQGNPPDFGSQISL